MNDIILSMDNISKQYGKNTVVDQFSLQIRKGSICGLIGPNGAGKTTIMRMLAGLTLPTSGSMQFFGDGEHLDQQRKRMSFMIENPIVDPSMTARENLQYVRYVRGVADAKRIDQVLEFVGLTNTGRKIAKKFSLGMRQRLGIAMSLMTRPEIMVLDEPVNGLDPEGIVEVRHMLLRLAQEESVTILISSHLLSELSELCTDFSIIGKGRLIEALSTEELLVKCRNHICLRTNDINRTAAVLEQVLGLHEYKVVHGDELHIFERLSEVDLISKTVTDNGLIIRKLHEEGESLEDYYLSKVGEEA